MKIEQFKIGPLQLLCAVDPGAKEIAYILYPMDMLQQWIGEATERYGVSIVAITGMDWDNDLTPWPAPGEPKGCPDFEGHAPQFLSALTETVIPAVERHYGMPGNIVRSLVGVSLSGLFTLWQWPGCDMFFKIATLSGSFWYDGFEQWIFRRSFADKRGRCYMLLGEAEPHSPTPAFRKVGECTESIVGYMRRQGVDITYDMVRGNHFQYGIERLDKAFSHLFKPRHIC
ncbi:MAG: alpha/beta hydrolase-fold protein [Pseudoflavonifractor sp.]|nr:alpha/beta hydrolase-fold protein [Alloprevotella sp.]MCM1116147.1 alpha/beta hydrolase-fold protein [Pseudoflavonifractor sp.]